jgi:hypothetical protein
VGCYSNRDTVLILPIVTTSTYATGRSTPSPTRRPAVRSR